VCLRLFAAPVSVLAAVAVGGEVIAHVGDRDVQGAPKVARLQFTRQLRDSLLVAAAATVDAKPPCDAQEVLGPVLPFIAIVDLLSDLLWLYPRFFFAFFSIFICFSTIFLL
jgi:hypothetical protein